MDWRVDSSVWFLRYFGFEGCYVCGIIKEVVVVFHFWGCCVFGARGHDFGIQLDFWKLVGGLKFGWRGWGLYLHLEGRRNLFFLGGGSFFECFDFKAVVCRLCGWRYWGFCTVLGIFWDVFYYAEGLHDLGVIFNFLDILGPWGIVCVFREWKSWGLDLIL